MFDPTIHSARAESRPAQMKRHEILVISSDEIIINGSTEIQLSGETIAKHAIETDDLITIVLKEEVAYIDHIYAVYKKLLGFGFKNIDFAGRTVR